MEEGRDGERRQSNKNKDRDTSRADRENSMLEKVHGGAKDMSVAKRKHFVELKHV